MAAAALLFFAAISSAMSSSTEPYDLVYSGCANQSFPSADLSHYLQALDSLSSTLLAKSAAATFYQTADQQLLHGLFQCAGDLGAGGCAACVWRIPVMWRSLCDGAAAARVQLTDCYALYEIAGFPQVSGTEMLYKECGGGAGVEQERDTVFESLLEGGRGDGFFAAAAGDLQAAAQCEGDLSARDCADCVKEAALKAEMECRGASSGRIYLQKCYLSYGSPNNGGGGKPGHQKGKTVAIVLGAAAALGFLVVLLLFFRSLHKKEHY